MGREGGERLAGVPVAVIGMSGVMPLSDDLEEFWINLKEARDLITEIPKERWDWREYYGDPLKEANKSNSRWGGFINDIDKFDASFFDISAGEADLMDPQQRVFLETVWKTIEDAGYKPSDFSGTKTGVYAGVATLDYNDLLIENGVEIEAYTPTGVSHSVLTNRVSYLFNLRGPSEAVNTACSSSLVAMQRGIEAIRNGACEMAIAGGVNAILSPLGHIYFGKSGVLSNDGKCRVFDRGASGYIRGEGCGAVLLKPLGQAVKDGDHIYGVLPGAAVNHGGYSNSLTAPNPRAQAEVLSSAYENARVDPATVTYIEAHGTGTGLGDSIEVSGLKKAFQELYRRNQRPWPGKTRCGLGSVKTNIGHLETAAGIAGVIKVLLAMKHGILPANLHFDQLNPYIRLEDSPFDIVASTRRWERLVEDDGGEIPRRAGVSSFGFGGTNAHVVIEEYMDERPGTDSREPCIIALSAANEERLKIYCGKLLDYLKKLADNKVQVSLADVAYTLQVGREAMDQRVALVVSDFPELRDILSRYCRGDGDTDSLYRGNARDSGTGMKLVIDGEDGADFIKNLVRKKKYDKLARLWVHGAQVKWELMYVSAQPRRVSLPTYPFARERHWMPDGKNNKKQPRRESLHPLIDRNVSTLREEKFITVFSGQEFILADHVVAGKKTLPGAAYLEMARAAGEIAGEKTVRKMTNVAWTAPLVVDGAFMEVFTSLRPDGEAVKFELYTAGKNGLRSVHGQGKIHFAVDGELLGRDALEITTIIDRCRKVTGGEECYRLHREAGFRYGPGFKVIKELYSSPRESLSSLELPPAAGFDRFVLHPSLLDGAIQTIVGLVFDAGIPAGILYLPFAVGEVEILGALSGRCYAHCTPVNENPPGTGVGKFNITIADHSGTVLLKIKDYATKAIPAINGIDASGDGSSFDEEFYVGLLEKLARGEITPDAAADTSNATEYFQDKKVLLP